MRNKKALVLGIALVLLAMVVGVAFAVDLRSGTYGSSQTSWQIYLGSSSQDNLFQIREGNGVLGKGRYRISDSGNVLILNFSSTSSRWSNQTWECIINSTDSFKYDGTLFVLR